MAAEYPVKLERNMRKLVGVLNRFPGIRIYASSGGHTKLSGRTNPAPKGEFYVGFVMPQNDPDGVVENNLSILRDAIRVYNGKVALENNFETGDFNIVNGWCPWSIMGKSVIPDDLADSIACYEDKVRRDKI